MRTRLLTNTSLRPRRIVPTGNNRLVTRSGQGEKQMVRGPRLVALGSKSSN